MKKFSQIVYYCDKTSDANAPIYKKIIIVRTCIPKYLLYVDGNELEVRKLTPWPILFVRMVCHMVNTRTLKQF